MLGSLSSSLIHCVFALWFPQKLRRVAEIRRRDGDPLRCTASLTSINSLNPCIECPQEWHRVHQWAEAWSLKYFRFGPKPSPETCIYTDCIPSCTMNTGEHTVALDVSEGGPWLSDLLSGAGSKRASTSAMKTTIRRNEWLHDGNGYREWLTERLMEIYTYEFMHDEDKWERWWNCKRDGLSGGIGKWVWKVYDVERWTWWIWWVLDELMVCMGMRGI